MLDMLLPKKILSKLNKNSSLKDKNYQSFSVRFENMIKNDFSPNCIFDCGASVGYWSYEISKYFPGSQIVAVEPNKHVFPELKKNTASIRPHIIIEECAIGNVRGSTKLNIWNNDHTKMSGSSLMSHVQGNPKQQLDVRIETIDGICEKNNQWPNLLKLDLQGGELDALKGATKTLKSCEVIISEFGCLPAYIDRTTPLDLMNMLYDNDYCLYDIIDLIYRPYDNALTGGDFIFVKNDSPLKKYKGYK